MHQTALVFEPMVHRSRSGFLIPSMSSSRAGTQNHLCLWFLLHLVLPVAALPPNQAEQGSALDLFSQGRDELRLEKFSISSFTLGRRKARW